MDEIPYEGSVTMGAALAGLSALKQLGIHEAIMACAFSAAGGGDFEHRHGPGVCGQAVVRGGSAGACFLSVSRRRGRLVPLARL